MFARLLQVRREMAGLAAGFDADLLTAADCVAVVREAGAIERMAATVKALAAARVAETELWRSSGARSAAEHLARETGTSVGQAREQLDTARRLREQPEVERAAREGRLSPQQAAAISDAAAADPAAEQRLVEGAARQSLGELRDACGRVKAAATDAEERHRRVHAERRVRTFTDPDGGWNLHLRNTPEVGAAVMACLRPVHDRLFARARKEGRREPTEAYAADALVELLLGSAGADVATTSSAGTSGETGASGDPARPSTPVRVASRSAKVVVRVDFDALVRGWPLDGETCEIAGIGPVPVSVVEAMLATGDAFLAAVVTRGVDIASVVHLGRKPTDLQVTALQWRDPTCTAEGCGSPWRLETDHRHDWAATKVTLLDWLDRLCPHHHRLKTTDGWALVPGRGRRPFVPPDDPRHPHGTAVRDRGGGGERDGPATGPPRRVA